MLGLEDFNYDSVFDHQVLKEEAKAEDVDDHMETQSTRKPPSRAKTHNYSQDEDVPLC